MLEVAGALVAAHLHRLAEHHVAAEGQLLLHAGDHGAAGRMVAQYASDVGAATIVIGAPRHGGLAMLMDASTSQALLRAASTNIVIVNPAAPAVPADAVAPAPPEMPERQLIS